MTRVKPNRYAKLQPGMRVRVTRWKPTSHGMDIVGYEFGEVTSISRETATIRTDQGETVRRMTKHMEVWTK